MFCGLFRSSVHRPLHPGPLELYWITIEQHDIETIISAFAKISIPHEKIQDVEILHERIQDNSCRLRRNGQRVGQYAILREDAQIVALMDINRANTEKTVETYKLKCGIYYDITDAIKHENANLVFDVTIPASRKSIVIPALEAGLDVFGEKPMASSMEESEEMAAAAWMGCFQPWRRAERPKPIAVTIGKVWTWFLAPSKVQEKGKKVSIKI